MFDFFKIELKNTLISAQREAAAQAARELVAKSHTQWHEQSMGGGGGGQPNPKVNKWNPSLGQKPNIKPFGAPGRFSSFGSTPSGSLNFAKSTKFENHFRSRV